MRLKQNKNSGFSLIELMVVVAILGIVAVGMSVIVLSTSSYRQKQTVQEISSSLSETRVQALSKSNAWMEIKQNTDGSYVISTSYAGDVILTKDCTIGYTKEGDAAVVPISMSNSLILTYDRSTGGFADIKTRNADNSLSGTGAYCESITVSKGSKALVITLYKETGKHKCED